jgi:amino-acid N-acetyltransferase
MIYSFAAAEDLEAIRNLLEQCNLPSNDLKEHFEDFIVAKEEGGLAGCVGLEMEGPLLRSLAVDPRNRNHGIAKELCLRLVEHARRNGATEIYLLTETASGFFEKIGFQRRNREEAPLQIRNHRQFTELCPSSAVLMWRRL